eukprot:TRINITY_DN519_c0_g1_i2.p2 TRINITY_DN519_c0_g1~~TRINITY_DN519_c0_g1_i2.p2  ORF type:complete len:228 (+),score=96.70 TRINITY_DN519_c0_g1_i2:1283-1966(+)
MSKAGQPLTVEQNDKITRYIVQKRCKQIIGTVKAFTTLRKLVRMKRAATQWEEKGRIASLIGGTVIKCLAVARKQIRERKEREGAQLMQVFFRASIERKYFIKTCEEVKEAAKVIWNGYNAMKQRNGLRQNLDTRVEQTRRETERLRIEKEEKAEAAAAAQARLESARIEKVVEVSKEKQLKILREKQAADREDERNDWRKRRNSKNCERNKQQRMKGNRQQLTRTD